MTFQLYHQVHKASTKFTMAEFLSGSNEFPCQVETEYLRIELNNIEKSYPCKNG